MAIPTPSSLSNSDKAVSAPAEIFVSYARVDRERVNRVLNALSDAKLSVWVDTDGLFAGEEFWPEIAKAIDSAAVLVFAVTPASVNSRFCRKELDRAVDRGKRVVPVICRHVDHTQLPQSVADRQWVFARDDDDPVAMAEALRHAIRADWMWLREQTWLLVKAEEWAASGYDRSLTLRGRNLRSAEKFLARTPPPDANPIQLHREFVDASRLARKRALLRAAGLVCGALCALLATGWLAVWSQIGSLNNLGYGELSRDSSVAAVEPLERAEQLCRKTPWVADRCNDVSANLARAYLDQGRYGDALIPLSRLIDAGDALDAFSYGRRASALLSRAYAHAMRAESGLTETARRTEYQEAEADLNAASVLFEKRPGDPEERRADITRARLALGRGSYQDALDALQRVAPYSREPDIDMLLFIAYRCLGDPAKTMDALRAYMAKLEGQTADPHWLMNQVYIERLAQRCEKPSS